VTTLSGICHAVGTGAIRAGLLTVGIYPDEYPVADTSYPGHREIEPLNDVDRPVTRYLGQPCTRGHKVVVAAGARIAGVHGLIMRFAYDSGYVTWTPYRLISVVLTI
jgi:hypothetical protein